MTLRALDPTNDRDLVTDLFARASDFVILEDGHLPDRGTVDGFFEDRPPDVGQDAALHLGLFENRVLSGILGLSFGYPEPQDCYIGLLLLSPDARGKGTGARALNQATNLARARGATRQLVAVLDANPKGRAFWEREGFVLEQTFPPTHDDHVRHRLTRKI